MVTHTPPHAPDWLFSSYQAYNPLADARNKDWFDHAYREDHQAVGLQPSEAPIVREACGVSERAYQDWKGVIDQLWGAGYCCQQNLNKSATDEKQEAARHDKHAAREHQEVACRQRLHNEHAAHEQE